MSAIIFRSSLLAARRAPPPPPIRELIFYCFVSPRVPTLVMIFTGVLYRGKRDPSLLSGSIGYVPQVHEPTGLPYTPQNRRGIPSTHEVDFLWY